MMSQFQSLKLNSSIVKASSLAILACGALLTPSLMALTASESVAQISEPATPQTPAASAFGDAYVLGPGDQVSINMFGQDALFDGPLSVIADGTISLPLIGRVGVEGSTISQAQVIIAERYKQFFKRPYVSVVLVRPRDIKVNIAGEVTRPGPYPIPQTEQNPTISSLIRLAGGHTQSANLREVEVRRPRKGGGQDVIVADLMRLIRDGDGDQNVLLRDGDTVVVKASLDPNLTAAEVLGQNSLTPDSSEPLNVAVVGEVYRPGPYVITSADATVGEAGEVGRQGSARSIGQPTVSQAIQRAGGIKPEADVRKIQVRRLTRFGSEQILDVDLWKLLQEGDLKQDIALQSRDTIIIPTATEVPTTERLALTDSTLSPATINVNIVGEVRQPGTVRIRPNTPLSQAVLAAGGFDNRRANKRNVGLIRLEPDGTVTQRRIKLKFDGKLDDERNPSLKNNDVVVVGRSGLTKFSDRSSSIFAPVTGVFSFLRFLPGI